MADDNDDFSIEFREISMESAGWTEVEIVVDAVEEIMNPKTTNEELSSGWFDWPSPNTRDGTSISLYFAVFCSFLSVAVVLAYLAFKIPNRGSANATTNTFSLDELIEISTSRKKLIQNAPKIKKTFRFFDGTNVVTIYQTESNITSLRKILANVTAILRESVSDSDVQLRKVMLDENKILSSIKIVVHHTLEEMEGSIAFHNMKFKQSVITGAERSLSGNSVWHC